MAGTVMHCIRLNKEAKKKCEIIYGELGVTLSAAINVFLNQSIAAGGFPFDMRVDAATKEQIMRGTGGRKTAEEKQ